MPSQFCVCNSHKSRKLTQGKFVVGQGKNRKNTGNMKMKFEWVPWPDVVTDVHGRRLNLTGSALFTLRVCVAGSFTKDLKQG